MTSISALSANSYQSSPLDRLQDELQSQVDSGAINSSDQSALSSALDDIDTSLQQDRSSGTRSSPGDMKSKIDDLIQSEVSSGKLTSDQATELQGVFKAAFAKGPGGGPGGPGGAGGPPPGPPPSDGSSSTDGTSGSSTDSSVSDLLQQFLQALQSSTSSSSSTSYDATGISSSTNSNDSSVSALLIDYRS